MTGNNCKNSHLAQNQQILKNVNMAGICVRLEFVVDVRFVIFRQHNFKSKENSGIKLEQYNKNFDD